MSEYYNPKADGAQMSFDGRMSYGDYLNLEHILNAQKPLSGAHDEMLFIIQHQTSELWMKLCVHELLSARLALQNDNLPESFKMLTRVARIMEQLNNAWDVLRTMTPSEYTQFRDDLGQSSGFQSHQYRQIEFILGNRNRSLLKPHEHQPRIHELLLEELDTPSLYDEVIFFLRRQGLEIENCTLKRNSDQPYESNASVLNAWRQVYLDPEKYWSCYELGEKCVDVEDYFRRWRFNHLTTVQRIIGFKRGTGGTSGVHYLKRMLSVELFPELWDVRTEL